ncbi:iron-sulfur cluster biosynthesis family protein [Bacillus timonensis]|nr:iron-sulfur cluster biosynthesis family protein [Bacillus timonensis]
MKITFTNRAIEKLKLKIDDNSQKILKLKYDTEGCGCVVSGVSALWLVESKEDDDVEIKTNFVTITVEKSKQLFFDEEMTIDIVETANCFMLKSPNQILNPRMMFIEKSGATT